MSNEKSDDSILEPTKPHTIAAGLGAAGGGIVGASIGKSVAGKFGAVVGGVAGAIAGSVAGDALADLAIDTNESLGLGLGANDKDIELPKHYSWEELRALSKPQGQSN
jgi:outer membrane lipoprotein SlyB